MRLPGRRALIFGLMAFTVLLVRPATHVVRAASVLAAVSDPHATPSVSEARGTLDVPGRGFVPTRHYRPAKAPSGAPALVLVHGVHRLGIEEPRLQRFARALAGVGMEVLTPEVAELRDYRVSVASIETIGEAVRAFGRPRVGLMGMSFGGGMSLLTAADPRFAERVGFVVAVGAHDDLARVSRFFATNEIERPSGTTHAMRAHEYGAAVFVYANAAEFFPPAEVPLAEKALRLWLWEKRDEAREAARALSVTSRAKVDALFMADLAPLRAGLLAGLQKRASDMSAVSPHGRLGGLRAHVYLLHGAGDTVIPATETEWLAKDIPDAKLREVLISPAIQHVEMKEPSWRDQWELLRFMSRILAEADES